MSNIRFTNALKGIPQNIPPIWFMRQAGRYHKHYQILRLQHSFMDLCKKPHLAAQVALGPVQDFDFDVAILFSDLLFPLEAMGMGLTYEDTGPKLGWALTKETMSKLARLESAMPHLQFQGEAMSETRKVLPKDKSLIGFVGGPWTLFTYAVQGQHDGALTTAKRDFKLYSDFAKILLPILILNIKLQFDGGAEVVMIFDTAAGEVSPNIYQELIVAHLDTLARNFPGRLGYYSKGTNQCHLAHFIDLKTPWAGLGVDHRWDMREELTKGRGGFLQGNFDQALLFADQTVFKEMLIKYLLPIKEMPQKDRAHWICGLGHGVLPKTPRQNVKTFVETVREVFG